MAELSSSDSSDDEEAIDFVEVPISDQRIVGFYSTDEACQTDVNEVIELKKLSRILIDTIKDLNDLEKELLYTRETMQAKFEKYVDERATQLYCRINEKLATIEQMQEERIEILRRAFRTQLYDALKSNDSTFEKRLEEEKQKLINSSAGELKKRDAKITQMTQVMGQYESTIKVLEIQLKAELQKSAEMMLTVKKASERANLEDENESLKERVTELEGKLNTLKRVLDSSQDNYDQVEDEVNHLRSDNDHLKRMNEQMEEELKEYKKNAKMGKKEMADEMERRKLELERDFNERLRKAREEILIEARMGTAALAESGKSRIEKLEEEKRALEKALNEAKKNISSFVDVSDVQEALIKYQKNEVFLKGEIKRLEMIIERQRKNWEKKFAILQRNLHAVKDESYTRQKLFKQAFNMTQAKITYLGDGNLTVLPNADPTSKAALPDIGRVKSTSTLPAIVGSSSRPITADENQVISDEEEYEEMSEFAPFDMNGQFVSKSARDGTITVY